MQRSQFPKWTIVTQSLAIKMVKVSSSVSKCPVYNYMYVHVDTITNLLKFITSLIIKSISYFIIKGISTELTYNLSFSMFHNI